MKRSYRKAIKHYLEGQHVVYICYSDRDCKRAFKDIFELVDSLNTIAWTNFMSIRNDISDGTIDFVYQDQELIGRSYATVIYDEL